MKLSYTNPPHIRGKESNFTVMGDVILALIPLYFMAFYFYGYHSVILGLIGVISCSVIDALCTLLAGRKLGILDLSPVVTGMIIPLLLPANIPYHIVIIACIFAIAVVKQPFGGLGQNIFNPASTAIAFVSLTWPQQTFGYPIPIEAVGQTVTKIVNSPAYSLKMGGAPSYDKLDMLLGNFPGPMGATHILVLLACLLYLVVRKTVNWKMSASFIASAGVFAFLFPRTSSGRIDSMMFELMSGSLLFAAVYMISDPTTSPKRESSKVVYAAICGVVTMIFRYLGGFEEGVFFALIFMNAFVWIIDIKNEEIHSKKRRAKYERKQAEAAQ